MGERIEGGIMPPPQSGKKRRRRGKYDWDKWFDGSVWRLTRGQDFQVSLPAFRGAAGAAAKRQGIRITTRKVAENTILLQAVGEAVPEKKPAVIEAPSVEGEKPEETTGWRFWRK